MIDVWVLIKILFLAAQFVYMLFSFVAMRQVGLMNKTFQTPYSLFFTILALAHFIAAVGIFLLSIVSL